MSERGSGQTAEGPDEPLPRRAIVEPPPPPPPPEPEPLAPPTAGPEPERPAVGPRPPRPPVQQEQAPAMIATQPGRIQRASERVWLIGVLLGGIGVLTAWIVSDTAVTELVTRASEPADEAARREVATTLHYTTLALLGGAVALEALLIAFLRRRHVVVRVLLTLLAALSAGLLPLGLLVLTTEGWQGVAIRGCLIAHAALALLGAVLVWLPVGRRSPP